MAQRLKTVMYAFPTLASLTNNTLTNFTQITIDLPESGKVFRRVWVEIMCDDIITGTGGSMTTKTVNLRLGTASYTSTTNSNTLTHSGENISWYTARDFTSHFTANWSGTSMTCDLQIQINQSTGTTLGMVNVSAILYITYEYDDTSSTHLKTVWVPLNGPTGALPTTKTSHDTFPALDTYLPEASKVYRNIFIVAQYNLNQANTTDHTVTFELSSLGPQVTGNYEAALATDRFTRYVWNITSYVTTSSSHTFNVWSSVADRCHSMQAWAVVTYEFNVSSTTSVMNSIVLPMEFDSPFGGTAAANFNRSEREYWIQESNPTLVRLALYLFWNATGNEAGLNARIGTGSFIAYTNTGSAVIAGSKCLMVRNDSPTGLTFGRGRRKLSADIYNTSTSNRNGQIGSFWIMNYTSDVHSSGVGAHNHTVWWNLHTHGTGAATQDVITASVAPTIPESDYFIVALGYEYKYLNNGTTAGGGATITAERLTSEGGLIFENIYTDAGMHDSEVGLNHVYAQARALFNRWNGDADTSRLALQTTRRYRLWTGSSAATATFHECFNMMITYHSITYNIGGTISGSAGGTVNLYLHRSGNGELVKTGSRVGNGSYNFVWYDNTESLFVVAKETATLRDVSKDGTVASDFDINLAIPSGSSVVGGRILIA